MLPSVLDNQWPHRSRSAPRGASPAPYRDSNSSIRGRGWDIGWREPKDGGIRDAKRAGSRARVFRAFPRTVGAGSNRPVRPRMQGCQSGTGLVTCCCSTPKAAMSAGLPLHTKWGSLVETAPEATKEKSGHHAGAAAARSQQQHRPVGSGSCSTRSPSAITECYDEDPGSRNHTENGNRQLGCPGDRTSSKRGTGSPRRSCMPPSGQSPRFAITSTPCPRAQRWPGRGVCHDDR